MNETIFFHGAHLEKNSKNSVEVTVRISTFWAVCGENLNIHVIHD